MKYTIIIVAMLAIFCLGISSLSEEASLVDSYIAKSQSEKITWKTNDGYGGAIPSEARKIWASELGDNTTLQSQTTAQNATTQNTTAQNTTALNSTAKAENSTANVGNSAVKVTSETKSLVDEYIAKSFNEIGTWKSNDVQGYATPHEARKAENQTG